MEIWHEGCLIFHRAVDIFLLSNVEIYFGEIKTPLLG